MARGNGELDTFLPTCSMFFTGYLSSTGSYFVFSALAWRCLLGLAPRSLLSHTGHRRLWFLSINGTGVLFIPFALTSTCQTLAFSVVGPSVWNSLQWHCECSPCRVHSVSDAYYSSLKTALFSRARVGSTSE